MVTASTELSSRTRRISWTVAGARPPFFWTCSSRFLYVRVSGSTRYVISTSGIFTNSSICALPRPLSPATAIRMVSFAPMTRPDDFVPPIANPAPIPAAID